MLVSLIIIVGFFTCVGAIAGFGVGYAFGDVATKNDKVKWMSLTSVFNKIESSLDTDKFRWSFLAGVAGAIVGFVIWAVYLVAAWLVITVAVLLVAIIAVAFIKTYYDAKNQTAISILRAEQKRNSAKDALEVKSYAFDLKREAAEEKRIRLTEMTAAKVRKENDKRKASIAKYDAHMKNKRDLVVGK